MNKYLRILKNRSKNFLMKKCRYSLLLFWNNIFNIMVRNQCKDYKSIPIIIISFNQLHYLKMLINSMFAAGYKNIVIIDNGSTYGPLLNYFDTIRDRVELFQLKENYGHRVFWIKKEMFEKYAQGYHVITDADILPDVSCPDDFVLFFKRILDKNHKTYKVGFSLKIDNIPDCNSKKKEIINWESKFWKEKDKEGNYCSDIDTTFALYRPSSFAFLKLPFFKAIRTKEPYIAVHGGWYIATSNLNDEQEYFMKTANNSSSWKINEEGNLTSSFAVNYKFPK